MTDNKIIVDDQDINTNVIKRGRPISYNKFKDKEFKRQYQLQLYHKTEAVQCTCLKYIHPFKLARHKRSEYHKKYNKEIQ